MSYYRELAFELRLRGRTDEQIKEILDEVQSFEVLNKADPGSEFGTPSAYAKQYELKKQITTGRKFTTRMTIAALLPIAAQVIVLIIFRVDPRVGFISPFLGVALVIALIGVVGGFVLDRRLPRGFVRSESERD